MHYRLCFGVLLFGAILAAQDDAAVREYSVPHPECIRFGPQYQRYIPNAHKTAVTALTNQVASQLPAYSGNLTPRLTNAAGAGNDIDTYIFAALRAANVTPAPATTDYEFIRRITLDLTGRIPTPARVSTFVASTSATKRADLVDELIVTPEWI